MSDPVSYTAVLPVGEDTVLSVSRLLATERARRGTRRGRRSLGCYRQAVLILRWFLDGTRLAQSVIHKSPSEAIELKRGDDFDDVGKLGQAPWYPVARIFQFFRCAMHRSTANRIDEMVLLSALSPTESSPPGGFLRGVVAYVPWYPGSAMTGVSARASSQPQAVNALRSCIESATGSDTPSKPLAVSEATWMPSPARRRFPE